MESEALMTKKEMLKKLWQELRASYKEWKKWEYLNYWSKCNYEIFHKQVYAYVILKKVRD
jgi:hypothetical protein